MDNSQFSAEVEVQGEGKPALRKINEKLYLKGNGEFTANPEEAYLVCTLTEAIELCRRYGLNDMGLVALFGNEEENDDLAPAEDAALIPQRGTYLKVA
jgi:hypothetical protein